MAEDAGAPTLHKEKIILWFVVIDPTMECLNSSGVYLYIFWVFYLTCLYSHIICQVTHDYIITSFFS